MSILHGASAVKISSEKVVVVLGRTIDALGSIVFLKMLSSLADKNDVGNYLLASSYLAMLLTISFSAFDQGLLRNVAEYRAQGSLAVRYSAMLLAYSLLAAVLSCALVSVLSGFDLAVSLHAVLAPLSLWLAFEAVKNLNATVASGLRSRSLIALASAVDYGCRLALLWAVFTWAMVTATAILYLLAAASLVAAGVFMVGHRALLTRFSAEHLRRTLIDSIKFSWPMIFWGLFGWLQNMANRWLLSHFADLATVAEYGVLVAIASFPVTALLGVLVTYVVPILYERESAAPGSSRPIVRRLALWLLPVSGLLVAAGAVWHRDIVILLSGVQYAERSHVLPIIMASACFSAVCSVLTYAVFAQRRVATLLLANTLPGVFSLAFGYLAVSRYQFNGAVLTLVLGHLVAGTLYVATFARATHAWQKS